MYSLFLDAVELSPTLQFVDLSIISPEVCAEYYYQRPITEYCVRGDGNKSSCNVSFFLLVTCP